MSLTTYENGNQEIERLDRLGIAGSREVELTAWRLVEQKRGRVKGGYRPVSEKRLKTAPEKDKNKFRKTVTMEGELVVVEPAPNWEEGDLLYQDARYAVEWGLSQGYNPLGQVHVYYIGGQVIVQPLYNVRVARAEGTEKFSTEYFDMTPEERAKNGLQDNDLGTVAFVLLDSDRGMYTQETLRLVREGTSHSEAKHMVLELLAKGRGIGVLSGEEIQKKKRPPTGRSWQWVVEKRALTDAINRTFGEPGHDPAPQGFTVTQADLPALADSGFPADAPADAQQRYLETARTTRQLQAGPPPTPEQFRENVNALRGPDDDDEFFDNLDREDHEEGEIEEPESTPDSDAIEFRQRLQDKVEAVGNNDPATEVQQALVADKLKEVFAPDEDAEDKALLVLEWLFDATYPDALTFSEAHALLGSILSGHDKETGDYPLKGEAVKLVKQVYRQAQLDAGQGE